MNKYNAYNTQDFLDDLEFVRFVKYPDRSDLKYWEVWRTGNPPNGQAYDEALAYLRSLLQIKRIVPTAAFASELFKGIESGILANTKRKQNKSVRLWTTISGVAAVLLVFGMSWYYQSLIVIRTGSGNLQTVVLPDGSVVHLNANSSIAYRRAWYWLNKREVYTTGEALLEVKHINENRSNILEEEKFTAYTGDLAVDVLGTKFNLKNRDNKITVSLLEGRISLRNTKKDEAAKILEPGDIIVEGPQGMHGENRDIKQVEQTISWTQKTLVGENLSIADLINEFRYLYKKEIVVKDTSLLNNKIDGRISLKSQESIIYSIANILKANIRVEKDTIYLDPKEE